MKPYLLLAIGLLTSHAQGAISLSLTDTLGSPQAVTILPGESFNITLRLNSSEEFTSGITYYLRSSGPGSSGFEIANRELTGSAFDDVTTQNNILFNPTSVLHPTNDNDLGGLASGENPAGDYFVAGFTIDTFADMSPGIYTIDLNGVVVTDQNFDEITNVSLPTYTVTVIPEPASSALFGFGLSALMLKTRRRK